MLTLDWAIKIDEKFGCILKRYREGYFIIQGSNDFFAKGLFLVFCHHVKKSLPNAEGRMSRQHSI
jgi:hypothetical protein